MRDLKYMALLVLASLSIGSCSNMPKSKDTTGTSDRNASLVLLSDKVHDFGEYREKVIKQCCFVYKNQGKKPLVIHKAESDCGCTQVKFNPKPLLPGNVDSVIVTYDGNGFLNGSFRKFIRIYSNAADNPTELIIKGSYFRGL